MTGETASARLVVTGTTKRSPYEPVGRALLEPGGFVIYLSGIGRFRADPGFVRTALLGLDPAPIIAPDGQVLAGERREGGQGFWFSYNEERYVIPGRSIRAVLEGSARKAVVMRYEEGGERG